MGIHCQSRLFETDRNDDIGGLTANAGQFLKFVEIRRNPTVIMLDQHLA